LKHTKVHGRDAQTGVPPREVRACFNETTLRVYQAFSPEIAGPATTAQTFVPPFKRTRMTWIKPSFAWMAYRSGWGAKPGQERILGIDILRSGFEWALRHSCLTHFDAALYADSETWKETLEDAPVRIQWDPERSLRLEPLAWRTIQIGLGAGAVHTYVDEWITRIEDLTSFAKEIEALVRSDDIATARRLSPQEMPYPLPQDIRRRIGSL
jgi:hypothetical protein